MCGWESRMSRNSVVPERWQPTTKIGGPDISGAVTGLGAGIGR